MLATRLPFEPEMAWIPAGPFRLGSDPAQDPASRPDERPQHTLSLDDYALARTPVTNAQYAVFLRRSRYKPPKHWRLWFLKYRWALPWRANYPVVHVSWYDALAYCRWLSEVTGKPYGLPSEAEWEKAARGPEGRRYPWGDAWDATRCNIPVGEEAERTATPVDAYPRGVSAYGLLDMVGNVWEWTRSLWGPDLRSPAFTYPYAAADGREDLSARREVRRVLRGVSFYNRPVDARCAARYRYSPGNRFDSVGFRVALLGPSEAPI
jgi:formylglycine-generating enzyme required for sulfatase activity